MYIIYKKGKTKLKSCVCVKEREKLVDGTRVD